MQRDVSGLFRGWGRKHGGPSRTEQPATPRGASLLRWREQGLSEQKGGLPFPFSTRFLHGSRRRGTHV